MRVWVRGCTFKSLAGLKSPSCLESQCLHLLNGPSDLPISSADVCFIPAKEVLSNPWFPPPAPSQPPLLFPSFSRCTNMRTLTSQLARGLGQLFAFWAGPHCSEQLLILSQETKEKGTRRFAWLQGGREGGELRAFSDGSPALSPSDESWLYFVQFWSEE